MGPRLEPEDCGDEEELSEEELEMRAEVQLTEYEMNRDAAPYEDE